ncbi:MAG: hydrogenase accessory protein HypB, partial [gamma proteobacterium symbiont of Stewartia floridana]
LLSVTEGDDKPAKYPVIFRAADHVLITKSDLLPLLDDFDPDNAGQSLQQLAYKNPITLVSAKSDQGMDEWLDWLEAQLNQASATEPTTASV